MNNNTEVVFENIEQRILKEMQHNFEQRKKKAGDKERDYHIFFIPKGT